MAIIRLQATKKSSKNKRGRLDKTHGAYIMLKNIIPFLYFHKRYESDIYYAFGLTEAPIGKSTQRQKMSCSFIVPYFSFKKIEIKNSVDLKIAKHICQASNQSVEFVTNVSHSR